MSAISVYLDSLHDKIFKILPQKDENNPNLGKYLNSLCIEVKGAYQAFPSLQEHREYIDIVNTLCYLALNEFDKPTCKSQMFKMQSLITALEERLMDEPIGGEDVE